MKYVMVIPDGAADEPIERLRGGTPLSVAQKPNIDWVAINGRQGTVTTVPKGFNPGSDVATLSLFGYDPGRFYDGRAPLEAAARGIETTSDQLIFRCNLVTIDDGKMVDFAGGHVSQPEADQLIDDLNKNVAGSRARFLPGVGYRNLLVVSDAEDIKVQCTPPHDIPDQPIEPHKPKGEGADYLIELMERARLLLADHEVNRVRRDLGENPATDIWLWGQGRPRSFPTFQERYGVCGALIAAVDLIRGIARNGGLELINVPGATGYLDTDYAAKGRAALEAIDKYELVVVHVESPDEAGHLGNADEKIRAIERIDEHIVGPVLQKLRGLEEWRILVAPDHPTPVGTRLHSSVPPPFCMAGLRVRGVLNKPFTEKHAQASDLHIDPGHELMEYFLKV